MAEKLVKSKDGQILKDGDLRELMEVEVTEEKENVDYKKSPVYIYYEWCKKCGICVAFCPTNFLRTNLSSNIVTALMYMLWLRYLNKAVSACLTRTNG